MKEGFLEIDDLLMLLRIYREYDGTIYKKK